MAIGTETETEIAPPRSARVKLWTVGQYLDMIEAGMRHFVNKQPLMTRIPENRLASMEVPTLVIFGGNSVIHDAQTAAETAERVLPDAGAAA